MNNSEKETSCIRCPTGHYERGTKTIVREREGTTLVVKDVPAEICDKCGEAALKPDVSRELSRMLDAAVEAGAETLVRHYNERVPAEERGPSFR